MITTRNPRIMGRLKKSLIADLGLIVDIVLGEEGCNGEANVFEEKETTSSIVDLGLIADIVLDEEG
jgi:metal-sulfur cluster biosynthetic enzyme